MGNSLSTNLKKCTEILNMFTNVDNIDFSDKIWSDLRNIILTNKEKKQLKSILYSFFEKNTSLINGLSSPLGAFIIFVTSSLKWSRTQRIKDDENLKFLLYFTKKLIKNIIQIKYYLNLVGIFEYSIYYKNINLIKKKETVGTYFLYRDKYTQVNEVKCVNEFKNFLLLWIEKNFLNEHKTFLKYGFSLANEANEIFDLNTFYEMWRKTKQTEISIYFILPLMIPIYVNLVNNDDEHVKKTLDALTINDVDKKHTNSVICNFFTELILYCLFCMDENNMTNDTIFHFLEIQSHIFSILFYLISVNMDLLSGDGEAYTEEDGNLQNHSLEKNKNYNSKIEDIIDTNTDVYIKRNKENKQTVMNNAAQCIQMKFIAYSPKIFFFEILLKFIRKCYKHNYYLFTKLTYEFLTYLMNTLYCDKYNTHLKNFETLKNKCLCFFMFCLFYKGSIIYGYDNKKSKSLKENKKKENYSINFSNENKDNAFLLTFRDIYDVHYFGSNGNNYYKNFEIKTIDFQKLIQIFIDSGNYFMNSKNVIENTSGTNDISTVEHVYFLLLYIFLYKNKSFSLYFSSNIDSIPIFLFVLYFFLKITKHIIYSTCSFSKNDIHLVTVILIIFVLIIHEKNLEFLFKDKINSQFMKLSGFIYETNYGNIFIYSILRLAIWNYQFFKNIFILELVYAILNNIKITFSLDLAVINLLLKYFHRILHHITKVSDLLQSPEIIASDIPNNDIAEHTLQATGILFKSILIFLCKNMNTVVIDNLINIIYIMFQKHDMNIFNNDINRFIHFLHKIENKNFETFRFILISLVPYLQFIKICVLYFYNKIYSDNKYYELNELQLLIKKLALKFEVASTNENVEKQKNAKGIRKGEKDQCEEFKNDYVEIRGIMEYYPKDLNVVRFKYDEDIYSVYFFLPYVMSIINKNRKKIIN